MSDVLGDSHPHQYTVTLTGETLAGTTVAVRGDGIDIAVGTLLNVANTAEFVFE